jgi:hypothetical protein
LFTLVSAISTVNKPWGGPGLRAGDRAAPLPRVLGRGWAPLPGDFAAAD